MPKVQKEVHLDTGDFILPVIVGSIARPIDKARAKYETSKYEWVVYLRGVGGMSLGHVVEKVVIVLWKGIKNPNRTLKREPFETYEEGWGTFEIDFRVYFKTSVFGGKLPPHVKMINMTLALGLEEVGPAPCNIPGGGGNTSNFVFPHPRAYPLAVERLDELIITNPPTTLPTPKSDSCYPRGPPHWQIWKDVQKYRPQWMVSETHQLARIRHITEALREKTEEEERQLEELVWERASLLQQLYLVEKVKKGVKKKRRH